MGRGHPRLNALCIVLFEVPVNKAMSHMTHATSISIGIACAAAGFLLMDSWPVGAVLILATLLWSAGEMIIFPSLLHYTSDISEPRRIGRNMGVYASGVTLGLMVTPSLALMLMEAEALPSIWHVVGVVLAATALGLPLFAPGAGPVARPVTGGRRRGPRPPQHRGRRPPAGRGAGADDRLPGRGGATGAYETEAAHADFLQHGILPPDRRPVGADPADVALFDNATRGWIT